MSLKLELDEVNHFDQIWFLRFYFFVYSITVSACPCSRSSCVPTLLFDKLIFLEIPPSVVMYSELFISFELVVQCGGRLCYRLLDYSSGLFGDGNFSHLEWWVIQSKLSSLAESASYICFFSPSLSVSELFPIHTSDFINPSATSCETMPWSFPWRYSTLLKVHWRLNLCF